MLKRDLFRFSMVAAVCGVAAVASISVARSADDIPALKIRIANSYTKDQSAGLALEFFAKRLDELSGGKITARVFHGGTLSSEDKSTQAVLDGTLDMGLASASNHGSFTQAWRVLEAPYLFNNSKQFQDVIIRGELGRSLRAESERDRLKPLMILETGGFRILGTNRAVQEPGDLKQMKVRVPQSPIPLAFWKAQGANPLIISWAETYLALASGTAEGLDAAWTSWPLGKLWEVTKFITDVKYSSVASIVDCSTEWWAQRTSRQQEIITQAAKEAQEFSIGEDAQQNEKVRQEIQKRGVKIIEPTPAQMEQWRSIGVSTWGSLPGVTKERLEQLRAALAKSQ